MTNIQTGVAEMEMRRLKAHILSDVSWMQDYVAGAVRAAAEERYTDAASRLVNLQTVIAQLLAQVSQAEAYRVIIDAGNDT